MHVVSSALVYLYALHTFAAACISSDSYIAAGVVVGGFLNLLRSLSALYPWPAPTSSALHAPALYIHTVHATSR